MVPSTFEDIAIDASMGPSILHYSTSSSATISPSRNRIAYIARRSFPVKFVCCVRQFQRGPKSIIWLCDFRGFFFVFSFKKQSIPEGNVCRPLTIHLSVRLHSLTLDILVHILLLFYLVCRFQKNKLHARIESNSN